MTEQPTPNFKRDLQWFMEYHPLGFSTCGNHTEFLQRLNWLQHGMLDVNLNNYRGKPLEFEKDLWRDYQNYLASFYVTTYCNFPHYVLNGHPIDHECRIIPTAALKAEMEGRIDDAVSLIAATSLELPT